MTIRSTKGDARCEIVKAMQSAKRMGNDLCLMCKSSRLLCGRSSCPLLDRVRVKQPIEKKLSKDMFGPSPTSIFVGHRGYPHVFIGPMASLEPEKAALMDDPTKWYGRDFNEIIGMRSSLVRSKRVQDIKSRSKVVLDTQELAMASRPADVEVNFIKRPTYNLSFSVVSQPMGPTGQLDKFKITENTKIPRKTDSLANDEVLASDASFELFNSGFDVYYLTKVLSSGVLGMDENKKLVPTRWSITAVDDTISKKLLESIREYPSVNEFRVYSNTYLDNHFEILVMPGSWEFEQFEAWAPETLWTLNRQKPVIQVESEHYKGRSDYAMKEGGGYYAARLAVTEFLERIRRQARVVVFREIYEGYVMPVGVWEVRENVRHALMNKPRIFDTKKDALGHISKKLLIPMSEYMPKSEILMQQRLVDW